MNDKWDIDSKSRKSAPKKGRRAGLGFSFSLSPKGDEAGDDDENSLMKLSEVPPSAAPLRSRKLGGWADDTIPKSSKRQSTASLLDHERLLSGSYKVNSLEDELLAIPSLDDYPDDDMSAQTAKAPSMELDRVTAYKELEMDLLKHAAFANLEDINLRVLTKSLYPMPLLEENDEPWTRDTLFAEVVTQLNEEKQTVVEDTEKHKIVL